MISSLVPLLFTLVSSSDPALLAPGPDELYATFDRSEWLVMRARSLESAVARLHNRFAELWAAAPNKSPCDEPEMRSIVARSRVFGVALRDAAQGARAEAGRLDRLFAARTIAAVIDAKAERRHEKLRGRVRELSRRYAELRAWHHAYLERVMKRCAKKLELAATPGLVSRANCVKEECLLSTAIIGIGGGRICPQGAEANGSVAIVQDGQACYGLGDCACVPAPVLPGAVLGP